jgi:hypothetical protein
MRHGEGILRFTDGSTLEGIWTQGNMVILLFKRKLRNLLFRVESSFTRTPKKLTKL